jgi:hypothetical protein
MKYLAITLGIIVLSGCATQGQIQSEPPKSELKIKLYSNNKSGIESIITNQALKSFNTDYAKATKNKAFAQSASGAWNWKSNRTSIEHAKNSALIGCQRNNKKSEYSYPCKVIHLNGNWVK